MNKYEKNKILSYILCFITKEGHSRKTMKEIQGWLEDSVLAEDFTTFAKNNGVKIDLEDRDARLDFKLFKDFLKNTIKKNISIKLSSLEKKLLWITEIFNLSKNENKALGLLTRYNFNTEFENFIDAIKPNRMRGFYIQDNHLSSCLQIQPSEVSNIFSIDSQIVKTCLVEIEESGGIELSRDFQKILIKPLKKKEDLKEKLIGKEASNSLQSSDFNHIKGEMIFIKKLLKASLKIGKKGVNVLLYGPPGTGKTELTKVICNKISTPLFSVGEEIEESRDASRIGALLRSQYILKDTKACLLLDEAEDVFSGFHRRVSHSKVFFNRILEKNPLPVLWTTNDMNTMDPAYLRRFTYALELKDFSEKTYIKMVKNISKKHKFEIKHREATKLVQKHKIVPSIINNAISTTKLIGGNLDDLEKNLQSINRVMGFAENKAKKKQNLKKYNLDLINSDLDLKLLSEKLIKKGKTNFSFCLFGVPGTGKSEYAKYLGNALKMKTIHKKASELKGMYVGQTEKNIATAFKEAEEKKAILIFDEADSFLQDRKYAQRSWEISAVNEMLTWMESHQYPFFCTTNLKDNLDSASMRRFTFKVKFDYLNLNQVKTAFKDFFNIKVTGNISELKMITTGDFAVVQKKAEFLDTLKDEKYIIQMLKEEMKNKNEKIKKEIGFAI
ncbi:MAG: AAA family ATPase [Alphaproteobacteria bacterium]